MEEQPEVLEPIDNDPESIIDHVDEITEEEALEGHAMYDLIDDTEDMVLE